MTVRDNSTKKNNENQVTTKRKNIDVNDSCCTSFKIPQAQTHTSNCTDIHIYACVCVLVSRVDS